MYVFLFFLLFFPLPPFMFLMVLMAYVFLMVSSVQICNSHPITTKSDLTGVHGKSIFRLFTQWQDSTRQNNAKTLHTLIAAT